MMKSTGKRVAIYARVSTDAQSTDNQLRELKRVARANGWQISGEVTDKGVSGSKGWREPRRKGPNPGEP